MNAEDPAREGRERRLFELLVQPDGLTAERRAQLEAEFDAAEVERERVELQAFFGVCRESLDPAPSVPSLEDARLARSILAATTREDLSWRGDLRLVGDFFVRRWDSSLLVRLVAASLVVHLAALPILGYMMIVRWQEPQVIKFEPPPDSIFGEEPGVPSGAQTGELPGELPEATLPTPDEAVLPLEGAPLVELWPETRDSAIAWARYHLGLGLPQASAPESSSQSAPQSAPQSSPNSSDSELAQSEITRMLAARAQYVALGHTSTVAPPASSDLILRVLWVEHLLDRFVLEGRVPAGFASALEALRAEDFEERLCCVASLARARDYHLLTADESRGLERELQLLASDAHGSARAQELLARLAGDSTARSGAPVDATWIEVLQLARPEILAADPVGRAWLAWRGARQNER